MHKYHNCKDENVIEALLKGRDYRPVASHFRAVDSFQLSLKLPVTA
jgi:hypothetical protein